VPRATIIAPSIPVQRSPAFKVLGVQDRAPPEQELDGLVGGGNTEHQSNQGQQRTLHHLCACLPHCFVASFPISCFIVLQFTDVSAYSGSSIENIMCHHAASMAGTGEVLHVPWLQPTSLAVLKDLERAAILCPPASREHEESA